MIIRSILSAAALSACAAQLAMAQAGPGLFLKPTGGGLQFDTSASATSFFETDTDSGDAEASLSRYETSGRYFFMPDTKYGPALGYTLDYMNLNTDGDIFPSDFTNLQISVGSGFPTKFWDDWSVGGIVGVGYAGTNSFGDSNGYYGAADLFFKKEISPTEELLIALDYDGNRTFMPDVPLPSIVWKKIIPERKMALVLGFPGSAIFWRGLDDRLNVEAKILFTGSLSASASYDLVKGVGVYVSVDTYSKAWHDNDLPRGDDRIIFEQSSAELGVRFSNQKQDMVVILVGGYAFEQEFRTGFDSRDTDEALKLDDTPYVKIEGQFSF